MPGGPITLAILGAGNRGRHTYARYALDHPDEARVIAVADPDAGRRETLAAEHGAAAHATWQEVLAAHAPDLVVVATPDREHVVHTAASVNIRQRTFGYTTEELKILLGPIFLSSDHYFFWCSKIHAVVLPLNAASNCPPQNR